MSSRTTGSTLKNDFSHLKNGRIDLNILREYVLQQIRRCTNQFRTNRTSGAGPFPKDRCVIIDDDIKNLLGYLQALGELGSNDIRVFRERQPDTSDYRTTLFIIRPKLVYMEVIVNLIKEESNKLALSKPRDKDAKQYGIIFVPRHSRVCEEKLKEKGVRGNVIFDELNLDFIPVDTDILSMHLNDSFRDIYLNDDKTGIINLAHGLINFQKIYGIIPNVFIKGDKAKQCYESMMRMQREVPDNEKKVPTQIDNLILIDRTVDLITPMMIPATYEALLDEIFGIQFNSIEVPTSILSKEFCETQKIDPSEKAKVTAHLLGTDWLYSETRYLHMAFVGKILQEGARAKAQLRADFNDKFSVPASQLKGDQLAAMGDFVKRMNQERMKSQTLSTHLEFALYIKSQTDSLYDKYLADQLSILMNPTAKEILRKLEERIAWKEDVYFVIRYLAVATQALGQQLKQKEYETIKRDLVQTYGIQYLILLHVLEQTGILVVPESIKVSTTIKTNENLLERLKREFQFLQEDGPSNLIDPQDIFYIFYQYAPLSIRFIEKLIFRASNNSQCQEIMNLLPGATMIDTQQIPMELKRQRRDSTSSINSLNKTTKTSSIQIQQNSSNGMSRATLVVFIGGVTHGEIAALKFLSGENHDFIIATTHFINGTNFMKSLLENQILPL